MLISRRSPLTGEINIRDVPCTTEQIRSWQHHRVLIQDAMPEVSAEDREFLMTGYTPEDWARMFPKDDE